MSIELKNVKDTTELCRYCLMCRHVCPITHVTRSEATSPHGWGILVASVERGVISWNDDTVNTLYQCADCGLCRAYCVTDQPLPLALNAVRAEVTEQKLAPAIVYDLQQQLQQWSNPYQETAPTAVTDTGNDALIVGAVGAYLQPESIKAATQLLAAAGVQVIPIAVGRESAYLPNTLGLPTEARSLAEQTLAEIKQVGAKRVFVLTPGDIYTYTTLFEHLGLTWPSEVELVELTSYLAQRYEAGEIAFKATDLSDYTFFDPDQTVRVSDRWAAPRLLLSALSEIPPTEMFWSKERAAPAGVSGGLPFTQPKLAATLAQTRLDEAAERDIKTIISDDPEVLHHLENQVADGNSPLTIQSLFELLAQQLKD